MPWTKVYEIYEVAEEHWSREDYFDDYLKHETENFLLT